MEKTYTLIVKFDNLQTILNALMEQPMKISRAAFDEIMIQAQEQDKKSLQEKSQEVKAEK